MDTVDMVVPALEAESHHVPHEVPFERVIEVNRLARAYVPIQRMQNTFDAETALRKGTVFPELYMPYQPRR